MRLFPLVLLLAVLLGASSPPCLAQAPKPTVPPGQDINQSSKDPDRVELEKQMLKKANQERQAQLKHDTESLVKLTSELKQYVDKSSENTLSLEVIKKAEEIERLARSVKEKMRGN